ncbi:MAG TPA: DHA2 family efflux MFS transporter permease subunit [Pseudonocardia sp.]|nr:DHA2 family efflux MFS transporter permease subunit [Pseudonocardia sp.]
MSQSTGAKGGASAKWLAPLLVLMAGSFMPPLDSAIVNVPILHIQKDLGGGSDDIIWISTAYSLGLAVFVPLSNWLAARFGLTLVHRLSMIGFLIGSGVCGMAWDLQSLVIFRILTAIPGSIVPVVTISMIYRIVPKESIGTAMGLYGLGVICAPSMGPVIGGLLVQDLSWRWIFLFKEPIGVITVIAGLFVIPKMERDPEVEKFDWLGFATFGYGLSAIIVVSDEGEQWHWDSYGIMILAVSGVLSLALFAVIENEVDNPLIDLRIFRCWPFVNSLLLIGVLLIMLFGVTFYVPQFLQSAQGYDAAHTGLVLLPMGLFMVFAVPIAGRLYDRVGPRVPAMTGMIGSVIGLVLLAGVTVDTSRTMIAFYVVLAMAGGALGMMPIMTNGLSWLPPNLVGYGGAMNNVVQRGAAAFAVAIVGVLVSRSTSQLTVDENALQTMKKVPELANADQEQLLALYQHQMGQIQAKADGNAFLVTAGAALIGVGLVWTLKRPPTAGAVPTPDTVTPEPGEGSNRPAGDPSDPPTDEAGRESTDAEAGHDLEERSDRSDLPEPRRPGRSPLPASPGQSIS